MNYECKITMEYDDEKTAKAIARSIKIDDYEYAKTTVDGGKIDAAIKASSLPGLLRSVDDYLACASLAEKVVECAVSEGKKKKE